MAERIGLVSGIQPPAEGKKMYGVKIGSKTGRFFGTQFESDEPNEILVMLRDAENRGVPVRATGEEITSPGMKYPMFKITAVEFTNGAVAGPGFGGAPVQTFQEPSRDRSIIAQVAYKVAAQLAASGAIDAEGKLEGFKAIADFVFYSILETAEGKATGAGAESASN